ncbi:helix-turn-helix transcriptional regulator [Streptomyces sp. HSW2009]|uniref:helix-turn-helix transcriptional regulator n=1 Tax=Streptomyces sp. HSW2009 TaxID=3142890 RepID=UPI0032EAB6BC
MASHPGTDARMRREQLSAFLRTRRARLTPGEVGMAAVGKRRTPGLRREEVAVLAGVGVSWYTWLEQGRSINVSAEVLDAIAGALRLAEPERAHLYLLAGLNPPPARGPREDAVPAELRDVLDAWSPRPAMLQDRHWHIIARNAAADALLGFTEGDHNCLVTFFTSARYRAHEAEWAQIAPAVVADFRADAAHFPGDPEFARIVADLSAVSPEFVALWERHEVGSHRPTRKAVHHPDAGELLFDTTTLTVTDRPQWHLVLYNPRPGTDTYARLTRELGIS